MESVMDDKRQFIAVDPLKCIGCSICEYACALEKDGFLNPLRSRIRVLRLHSLVDVVVVCRFCNDAPCVRACPRDALSQPKDDGILSIDEEKCDTCGWCIPACPYGAIMLHPDKKVVMACDLCSGDPQCLAFCPEEALELVTDDASAQKMWINAVDNRLSEAKTLTQLTQRQLWWQLLKEADKTTDHIEEKLKALNRKELEQDLTS
jgi:Fe-S-cluster-containing hydrogenase component 2